MAYQKLQAGRAASVTPSDTLDIPSVTGGINDGCVLYVGIGGDLTVTTTGQDVVTFVNIQDGTFIPVQVLKVLSTGTTATGIIALW
ncbi:hypothetical protein [Lutibacter sp.]|uniref:spike base protein, RCAP_Rcc01079 family n=1 Tax=Lutibacter sp. TaxID=1925666 RepID=UPI0034A09C7E